MEWVETTGRTIEEAKEAALDELGVDEQDAEFEVLEEPKVGLFGRLRSEGRIRARVRPTTPRAKDDRGNRRRRPKAGADGSAAAGAVATAAAPSTGPAAKRPPSDRPRRNTRSGGAKVDAALPADAVAADAAAEQADSTSDRPRTNPSRRRGPRGGGTRPEAGATAATGPTTTGAEAPSPADGSAPKASRSGRSRAGSTANPAASSDDGIDVREGNLMDVPLDEQGKVAEQFLVGLLDSFGLAGQIAVHVPDDDTVDIQVTGDDLGHLIGPKGATLIAIQDLTRTVVQRKTNAGNGRIFIDVAGYRQKRNAALARFARKIADDVLASNTRVALEPMSAPDRKTVHDAITEIAGVATISEGEDALRHVVVIPAGD